MGLRIVQVLGGAEMEAKLRALGDEVADVAATALAKEATQVMERSEPQVPIDTGVLRGSGTIAAPTKTASGASIEMGYGQGAEAYAVIQHEAGHFNHPSGGKSHFLSDPLHEHAAVFANNLAAAFRSAIGA